MQLGTTRPHRVLLFENRVCWSYFNEKAGCEPKLSIAAKDLRDFGHLLFIKGEEEVQVINVDINKTYSLKTKAWFPESPPSRLQINNHGTCEWIDELGIIRCELHGKLKLMETSGSCDKQPLLNAFNLVAIIGICVSLTTLCLILAYYNVSSGQYSPIEEDRLEEEQFELVKIEKSDLPPDIQETVDTLI